jgi:hydrogenase expression/formation protein HypC
MCAGTPARVLSIDGDVALVDVDGRTIPVSLVVLDEAARIGDWLLVHSGLAVARIDDQDLPLLLQMRGDRP